MHEPDIRLEQVDPRAQLCVITDAKNHESGFISGAALRDFWWDSRIQQVHGLATPISVNPENPWHRCLTPDGSTIFIKFLSPDYRLLDEETIEPEPEETNMPSTKKAPPPRKGSSKTTTASSANAKSAKVPPPPNVKPVSEGKGSTKSTAPKPPKEKLKPGPTTRAWLLERFASTNNGAPGVLSTPANRSVMRDGLKDIANSSTNPSFNSMVKFLARSEVAGAQEYIDAVSGTPFGQFMEDFMSHLINKAGV